MKKLLGAVLLSALVLPHTAWAVDACTQDRLALCGNVTPGKGAIHQCMLLNVDKLSPDCKKTVQGVEALVQQWTRNCRADVRMYCSAQLDSGISDAQSCMKRHQKQFTAECQQMFRQYKAYDYPVGK